MSGALVWGLAIIGSYFASLVYLTRRRSESFTLKSLIDISEEPLSHLMRQIRSKGLRAFRQPEVAWAALCATLLALVFGIPIGRELLGLAR